MDSLMPGSHISGNHFSVSSALTAGSSHVSFNPQELEQFKNQVQHQVVVLQRWYQELKNSSGIEERKTQELMQEITVIKEELMKPLSDKMSNLQKFVGKITDENAKLKRAVENEDIVVKKLKEETEQEINALKIGMTSLTNAVEETRTKGMIGGASVGIAVPEDFPNTVNVLEQQMGSSDMRLTETDLRFQVLEKTNGILSWKIRDFNRRKDDAKQDGALFINSQDFYTSKNGYKMRLCICLNADGMGEDAHISLYLVVMKGKYDASLPFPFQNKVTLSLLEHGSEKRALTPDPSSFMKPISDMNIGSGFPKFVSHDQFKHGNYVVDDTISVKAVIEGKVD